MRDDGQLVGVERVHVRRRACWGRVASERRVEGGVATRAQCVSEENVKCMNRNECGMTGRIFARVGRRPARRSRVTGDADLEGVHTR